MTPSFLQQPQCIDVAARFVGAPSPALQLSRPLSAALPSAFAATGTAAFRHRAVRECLDTLAMLRAYRAPLPGEAWTVPLRFERRLLAQVDAITCLGAGALNQVAGLALDPDVPDPDRVFAALFTLGCVAGETWLPVAVRLFAQAAARSPVESAAAAEALSLSPNLALDLHIEPLCMRPEPAVRAAAVRVLAERGRLGFAAWCAAMDDRDAAVTVAACAAAVHRFEPHDCEPVLAAALRRRQTTVVAAALRCCVALRSPVARQAAIALCQRAGLADANDGANDDANRAGQRDTGDRNDRHPHCDATQALLSLALHGDPRDAPLLADGLAQAGSTAAARLAIRAAGVFGSLPLVDLLVERLRDLAPDHPLVPDLRAAVHHATALDADAGDGTAVPTALPAAWQALRRRALQVERLRAGRAFGLQVLRDLLQAGPGLRADRAQLHLELAALCGAGLPRWRSHDFIATQQRALQANDGWLQRAHGVALPAQA